MNVVTISKSLRLRSFSAWFLLLALAFSARVATAQTGGEGGITGTVTDSTGALVKGATVTATSTATSVATTRDTTSDGLYTIAPIIPGTYTVTVKAPGFNEFVQDNLVVDALHLTGLNVSLKTGSTNVEVTVTSAPSSV